MLYELRFKSFARSYRNKIHFQVVNADNMQLNRTSTKEDVRDLYRLKTVRTVELWMKAGLIPYMKIGKLVRFNLDEVQKTMAEKCGRNRTEEREQ